MLTFVKIFAALIGALAGIVSVLTDYRDKTRGSLTRAGKFAITLIVISLTVGVGVQLGENYAQQRSSQEQVVIELKKQRQLLEAIRASALPLDKEFQIELLVRVDGSYLPARAFLKRLKDERHAEIGESSSYFLDGDPSSPQKELPGEVELREHLRNALCFVRIFSETSAERLLFLEAGSGHFSFKYEHPANIVTVEFFAFRPRIMESTPEFSTFADLAGKRVEVIPWFLGGLVPTKLVVTSATKQKIEATEFKPAGLRAGWGDAYAAVLGNIQ